jgi:hypothetical protein
LPAAKQEIQQLNAAIQADAIGVIELMVDDTRRELSTENKATLTIRFREDWFPTGGIGVVLEVMDTESGRRRLDVKNLLLRADHVRTLRRPAAATSKTSQSTTARWIAGEVTRMKEAGEISADIRITGLAKRLAKRMEKAAQTDNSLRWVGWRHIKNSLPTWGLWPIR